MICLPLPISWNMFICPSFRNEKTDDGEEDEEPRTPLTVITSEDDYFDGLFNTSIFHIRYLMDLYRKYCNSCLSTVCPTIFILQMKKQTFMLTEHHFYIIQSILLKIGVVCVPELYDDTNEDECKLSSMNSVIRFQDLESPEMTFVAFHAISEIISWTGRVSWDSPNSSLECHLEMLLFL